MIKEVFVSARQFLASGGTRDILSLEVEGKSGLGRLIQETLDGKNEMEVVKEWPTEQEYNSVADENNDCLKIIHGFISQNSDMKLKLVIGVKDLSQKMPDGGASMKISSEYLYAEGGRILWDQNMMGQ